MGRFEELVVGVRLTAPSGEIALPARPASAAGPDLRKLLVGSEGTLGVISQLDLRLRPGAARALATRPRSLTDFTVGRERAAGARAGSTRRRR